jgi:RNA polymerase sigma factor (sigma-70 family)
MPSAPRTETLRQIQRLFTDGALGAFSDADLLRRFAEARDEAAFAELVERHGRMVFSVCRSILRDPRDAEDAFQATFLALVRQARGLWVDASLSGWLHRVAHRVSLRMHAQKLRRNNRERSDVVIDAVPTSSGSKDAAVVLHEEIARLPESYRRAVVLCYLEGITQEQAARTLRCGEATLRRRLAGARDRLRLRLSRRGLTGAFVLLDGFSSDLPAVPNAMSAAATRAAILGLARWSWRAWTTATVAVVLVATLAFSLAAQHDAPPKPSPQAPAVKARPKPQWLHAKFDAFFEDQWVNLDDGRVFTKSADSASLKSAGVDETYEFKPGSKLVRTKKRQYKDDPTIAYIDRFGRKLPSEAMDVAADYSDLKAEDATEEEKKTDVYNNTRFETLNGRRCWRADQFWHDALGEVHLHQQLWVDMETRLPVRIRRKLQVADQHRYKKDFYQIDYDYPATGPADLFALGVPKVVGVIERVVERPFPRPSDLDPQRQEILQGGAEAFRKFPRDVRIIVFDHRVQLFYWSAPAEWMDAWADHATNPDIGVPDGKAPRVFQADNQGLDGRTDEINDLLEDLTTADHAADKIAARLPLDKAVNIGLDDGKRLIHLTRGYAEPGKPRPISVHVLKSQSDVFLPEPFYDLWPYVNWNLQEIRAAAPEPEPDTPPGLLILRTKRDDMKMYFEIDPAHDFIASRMIEWQKVGEKWDRRETRALTWKRLPNGSWYVAAWEQRWNAKIVETGKTEEIISHKLVDFTPMRPEDFPKTAFDGDALLDSARKQGAKIEVD